MGTKVQNLPGYYSMRDLNEEASSCGWPLFYGDKTLTNGHYYNSYLPSTTADACSAYDKDLVKRTMLEHEAIFKSQVHELHRLYRIQRDLMDEVRRKELHRNQMTVDASFSTGRLASQITSEDGQKWHMPGFPMANSVCARPSHSVVEDIHSPLDSIKGHSKQASLFPSPNRSSSKDVEVLQSRPSKVRRKMFDLQLPADEYIDTEESEKLSDEKISSTICLPERNGQHGKKSDVKFLSGNVGKPASQEDTSRCEQSLRSRNGLADLNEPIQVEETSASEYALSHNPCQRATDTSDICSKQKSRFFGLSQEDLLNLHHGTDNQVRNNGYLESKGCVKGWISSVLEAGQAKNNLKPMPQVIKQEQSILASQNMSDALKKGHKQPPSDYLMSQNKADFWREKTVFDLEISERSHEMSINKHPESVVSSHRRNLFRVSSSSDLANKSWFHSAASWDMGNSSFTQKSMSVQMPPCLSRGSQSGQSNGIFGDNWSLNSKSNPGLQCEVPAKNGYYPVCSSGFMELPVNVSSISYDYPSHNNDCKRVPEHFMNHGSDPSHNNDCKRVPEHFMNHGSETYFHGSNCSDMKSGKDINLNVNLSNGSSDDLLPPAGHGILNGEQKLEEQLHVLPWFRAESACKNEVQNAGRSLVAGELSFSQTSISNKDETGKRSSGQVMHNVISVSCSNDIEPEKEEIGDISPKKKILGIPIFDMRHISPKESSSLTSPCVSIPNPSDTKATESNCKNQVFDINIPCDPSVLELDEPTVTEATASNKESTTTGANSRNHIDLNLIMSEDEACLIPISSNRVKMKAEIDLEAPALPETEEDDTIPEEKQLETSLLSAEGAQDKPEQPQDEFMTFAAEVIVAISSLSCNQGDDVVSSPSESLIVNPLSWFVDVVSSCMEDHQSKSDGARGKDRVFNERYSLEGLDYFESMTLKLTETKEEDYMPPPLVPENFKVEETGSTLLPTRGRKGPARRGRQRRDFQRDILPGLTSLSRHEVTEDLQTFGGLMRATGHSWSGLTRRNSSRNGCGRGRRRLQANLSPPPMVATNETCTQLIQQLNNIEVRLEDRNLASWGKTTRRPRRQRYPAGNPPPIPLT